MLLTEYNIVQHLIGRSLYGFSFPSGRSPLIPPHQLAYERRLLDFRCSVFTDYQFVDHTSIGLNASTQPMYCCSFGKDSKTGHLLAYGGEDGNIFIVDSTQHSDQTNVHTRYSNDAHADAVIDVSWVPDHDELVSCSGDNSVMLWKLGQERLVPILKLVGHTRTVKTVQVNPYDPMVIASGSRDCNVVVWDRRCGPQYRADQITPAHPSSSASATVVRRGSGQLRRSARSQRTPSSATLSNAVASLVFYEQHTLVSAGSTDGLIKMWDLRKTHSTVRGEPVPVHTLSQPQSCLRGFGWACAPERSHYLYALGIDCKIYAYHLAVPNTEPVSCYTGCCNTSHYVRMSASRCGRYLVCGGADGRALLWLTSRPGPPVAQLTGHAGEVSAVDWGQFYGDKIATCGDDCHQKIFYMKDYFDKTFPESSIQNKAEPVDETILARCPITTHTSSKRRLLRFSGANTMTAWNDSQDQRPVPKTPSSRQQAQTGMSTPLRDCRSGVNTRQDTPGQDVADSLGINVHTPAPLTPSNKLTDHTGQRVILSTPRQHERKSDSHLPVAGSGDIANAQSYLHTPGTPSSVDKSITLLQWLSTAKKSSHSSLSNATPKHTNQNQLSCSSASKRAGIKRKLTDALELGLGDEENELEDGSSALKKRPTSPTHNVLSDNNHNTPSSVAKMLVYSKSNDREKTNSSSKLETISEIGESVQPFETSMLDTLRNSSLRNSFSESKITSDTADKNINIFNNRESSVTKSIVPSHTFTPVKEIARHSPSNSRFESPTANLPNFVEDGTSPRPVPVFREKQISTNWLSAIASQRKLKFGATPEAKAKGTQSRKANSATKRSVKVNVGRKGKKFLKIVPLSDTSSESQSSAKKSTQTKLPFS